jgi:hypothetical protein
MKEVQFIAGFVFMLISAYYLLIADDDKKGMFWMGWGIINIIEAQ